MIGMMHEVIGDLYHAKETNEINTILWSETVTIHRTFLNLLHEVAVEKFEITRIPGIDNDISPNKRRTNEQDSEQSNKK